jgi:hypothetical protein
VLKLASVYNGLVLQSYSGGQFVFRRYIGFAILSISYGYLLALNYRVVL